MGSISFVGEARDCDVRDIYEDASRAYLRRHGIEPGRRWGAGYTGKRSIGDAYLFAMDWVGQQPTPEAKP